MNKHVLKIYTLEGVQSERIPVYVLEGGKLFRTDFHPEGWSDKPDYDLGLDGRIYRTEYHPDGVSELPDYEFGTDRKIYRTEAHPGEQINGPEFEIKD